MLKLNFRPAFTWIDFHKRKSKASDATELLLDASPGGHNSLSISAIHCKTAASTSTRHMRDSARFSRARGSLPSSVGRDRIKRKALNELREQVAEWRVSAPLRKCPLAQRDKNPYRRPAAMTASMLRLKCTRCSVRGSFDAAAAGKQGGSGTQDLLVMNSLRLHQRQVGSQKKESKRYYRKVDFKSLALKRETLLRMSECEQQYRTLCESRRPVLMVSQMSAPFSQQSQRRAQTAAGTRGCDTRESWLAMSADRRDVLKRTRADTDGWDENEYGLVVRRSGFRPITSGAVVVKTRAGRTLLDKSCW